MQEPSPLASRSGFGYGAGMARALKPCPASPNCVSSLAQEDETYRVPPLAWTGDLAQAKMRLRSAVLAAGDATFVAEEEAYWHVEFRSRVFRFVDDVEFLFGPAGRQIHVRSASRVGYSDFGANRRRIEEIRALFR